MADRLSKGPLRVAGNSVLELNRVLAEIQDRIDEAAGLRGRAQVFDRVGVSNPVDSGDALNLSGFNVQTQTLPIRLVDSSGTLVHAFGTTI